MHEDDGGGETVRFPYKGMVLVCVCVCPLKNPTHYSSLGKAHTTGTAVFNRNWQRDTDKL